jgi:DNA-binding CsgD family transcriptional regulator
MPDPIATLLLVLALAAGLAAAIFVAQQLRPGDTGFYRHYLTHLLLFNLLILSGLVLNFLQPQAQVSPSLVPLALTLMAALKLGWLLAYTAAAHALLAGKQTDYSLSRHAWLALALWTIFAALTAWAWFTHRSPFLNGTVMVLEIVVLTGAVRASVRVFLRGRRLPGGGRQKSILQYGSFHSVFFSLVLAMLLVSWLWPGPERFSQLTVSAALLLFFNLFPPFWIRHYRPAPQTARPDRLSALGITPRENEIIHLIQAGRTNQEIADELFISLATVKDHNNKLFRKCGVRNRVELANLFR